MTLTALTDPDNVAFRLVRPSDAAARAGMPGHRFVDGVCVPCDEAQSRSKHSVEGEAREPHTGKWIHGAGEAESAGKDALKLANRIQLGDDEKLASSSHVTSSTGDHDVTLAAITGSRGREYRLGIIGGGDAHKWAAANKGGTVRLDEDGITALRSAVNDSNARGKARAKEVDAAWKAGNGATAGTDDTYLQGVVQGDWGDLYYEASTTDDDPASWHLHLAVKPDGASADWKDSTDFATFDAADIPKLSKLLNT